METNKETEVYFELITKAQAILVEYLKPDGGLSAEDAINEILGILDNEQLAELTAKHNPKKD